MPSTLRTSPFVANPGDTRWHNLSLIMRTIWKHAQERTPLSRTDLVRLTKASGPTITAVVNELERAGLVRSCGEKVLTTMGGRRATPLCLGDGVVVAVDWARHSVRVGITDMSAALMQTVDVKASHPPTPADITLLRDKIEETLAEAGIPRDRVLGLGMAVYGPLQLQTGEVLAPASPLRGLKLVETLQGLFPNVFIRVENDAKVSLLAQHYLGHGKQFDYVVYIAASSGVGGAILNGGTLLRGANGLAGEIGHVSVRATGETCYCQNIDCLELHASLRATLDRWVSIPESVARMNEAKAISVLISSAKGGDQEALNALTTTAEYLAIGVINAINLYNPQVVYIGRELAEADEMLLGPIRAAVSHRALTEIGRHTPIWRDELGDDAPLRGAACLILRELFEPSDFLRQRIGVARRSAGA